MIKVYSREGCPKCTLAKKTMTDHGIPFEELKIGRDVTREEVLEKFPNARELPLLVVEERLITLDKIMLDLK